ncbi:MAG: glycosyltransferase family 39 protein [Candidatus Korobacteraceae bacterium]
MVQQMVGFSRWPLGERLLVIIAVTCLLNVTLIAIPGYFSHDELDWSNRILSGDAGWGFGLSSLRNSPFFRPLGAPAISLALRLPLQPFTSHAALVFLQSLNCCLLYLLVRAFRPDRALAAAILFAIMPGTAFAAGWIAAFFDLQFTFFALCSFAAAIKFWRRRDWIWGILSVAGFAAGLLCKETAIVIPLGAAVLAVCDRARADLRRVAMLGGAAAGITLIYALLRLPALIRIGTTGVGGYAFGKLATFGTNALSYFGFPFAIRMTEITGFSDQSWREILIPIVIHAVLVGFLWVRCGKSAPFLYLIAYFLPLLPVLIISKYDTHYFYASSIAMSVALALMWGPRLSYAIPTIALGALLVLHGFRIQYSMYVTGACQTRALQTTAAVLPLVNSSGAPIVYASDSTPWWVLAGALHGRVFHVDGRNMSVVLSHHGDGASLQFSADCDVTLADQSRKQGDFDR